MTKEKIFLALFKPEHFIGSCDLDDVDMVELTKEETNWLEYLQIKNIHNTVFLLHDRVVFPEQFLDKKKETKYWKKKFDDIIQKCSKMTDEKRIKLLKKLETVK